MRFKFMNLYIFYNLLALKALLLYNSLLNHCLVLLVKVWIMLKNHNLNTVFRHRMCSLYVKSDEAHNKLLKENGFIFSFFFFLLKMFELLYPLKLCCIRYKQHRENILPAPETWKRLPMLFRNIVGLTIF